MGGGSTRGRRGPQPLAGSCVMAGKPLTALTATVTTATVSIKTITIDRRQVTLSTFRQVPERDIFDADAVVGIPWGRVNYCPGKLCTVGTVHSNRNNHLGGEVDHDHLLWQDGDTLYRCRLADWPVNWPGWKPGWYPKRGERHVADLNRALSNLNRGGSARDATVHAIEAGWKDLPEHDDKPWADYLPTIPSLTVVISEDRRLAATMTGDPFHVSFKEGQVLLR